MRLRFLAKMALAAAIAWATLPDKAFAEGHEFEVSASELDSPVDPAEGSEALVTRLKQLAVRHYLSRALGEARFAAVETTITAEFAERYILDYKLSRPPGGRPPQLSGHLDAELLRRWARVTETRSGERSVKPVFVYSSAVPGLTAAPRETVTRAREDAIPGALYALLSGHLQGKFNVRLTLADGPASLTHPPRTQTDMRSLQEFGASRDANAAVWMNLVPCKPCGGARLDSYFFNLSSGRAALIKRENIPIEGGETIGIERAKKLVKEAVKEFTAGFDDVISQGTATSGSLKLIIEAVDSYRGYKRVDTALGRLDFASQAVLKRVEPGLLEFEILTSIPPAEMQDKLALANFPGFSLKPVRIDSTTVVMRYSR